MASPVIFRSLILSQLLLLLVSADYEQCPSSFMCGDLGTIKFPVTVPYRPHCGILAIHGCHDPNPMANKSIRLSNNPTRRFRVRDTRYDTITITDDILRNYLPSNSCKAFNSGFTLPPSSPIGSVYVKHNITLFRCNKSLSIHLPQDFHNYTKCPQYNIYYGPVNIGNPPPPRFRWPSSFTACSKIQFAIKDDLDRDELFSVLSHEIIVKVQSSADCTKCIVHKSGQCQLDNQGKFDCVRDGRSWVKMGLGVILEHYSLSFVNSIISTGGTVFLVLVMVTLYYTRPRKRNPTPVLVGAFLERHGHLQIKSYSYAEIKKVINSFKNKLGQGGFGCVYKGQLQDGGHVAVKLLNELKGDGEDFINEVASMSRTSHVNIVALLGFCFESSKRALIYEFMPNGSLEKFIYEKNDMTMDHQLDCQTLYDIAIGVARGLEYLHKGCNTRILHFDIKPHNILLDENLCPKISDFGLAKVCTRKESMVSIFGARGTVGYIAPEVFSRNFGTVSHKSDVYSYGMMVLEMVGRRKNIKIDVNASSEIYFPHWIYNHLLSSKELGLRSIKNESDNEKVRKMAIVSLWCIQTNPSTRPSISKVVELLEGRVELLQLPPKPFWFSPRTSPDHLSREM